MQQTPKPGNKKTLKIKPTQKHWFLDAKKAHFEVFIQLTSSAVSTGSSTFRCALRLSVASAFHRRVGLWSAGSTVRVMRKYLHCKKQKKFSTNEQMNEWMNEQNNYEFLKVTMLKSEKMPEIVVI